MGARTVFRAASLLVLAASCRASAPTPPAAGPCFPVDKPGAMSLIDHDGPVELWGGWLEAGESSAVCERVEDARVLACARDLDGALELLELGLAELPGEPALHAARGGLMVEMGFLRSAEIDYERATGLDPNCARSWWCLGLVRHRLGLHLRADEALRHAFELGLRDPELLILLSEVQLACAI